MSTNQTMQNNKSDIAKGSIFIIAASSGTGKTSLVKELISNIDNLKVSVSHTTRQPRVGETDGVHYHFTDVDSFRREIEANSFLEYAEVFGNLYGTSKKSVQEQIEAGIDVILEIDWQGALQVKELFIDTNITMIFILPPSIEELRNRLSNRGQDSAEVIENRLAGSVTEIKQYDKFDYLVINNDFQQALAELTTIIMADRLSISRQCITEKALINKLLS